VASLVDITYLFDTGALVDFTTEELVNVIKALFADSPKRDAAIERIEKGVPQGAAEEA
jgi:centromere/kinetochore protein ZW10